MYKKPYTSMPDYMAYVSNEEPAFMKLCLDVEAKVLYFYTNYRFLKKYQ